ncbi:MAG TPA: DUF2203 domain-containing protein [Anaerolineae bacterium]|nr:DUF2203 domain-containing protein [Anaerolineae bacterium]
MTKHFTAEEANRALPQVRLLVAQIMQAREAIIQAQPELWPVLEKSIGNGGSKKAGELLTEFRRVELGMKGLQEMGCVLKDMSMGLVDFPALREGREVLLCWKYNEPEVMFWHDLQSGYQGRKSL